MTVEFILSIVNLVDVGTFPKKPLKLSQKIKGNTSEKDSGTFGSCSGLHNVCQKKKMNSLSPNSGKYYKWQ